MPMTELNKLLADAFGHVTHKLSFNEDQIVCSCGAHYNGEGYHDRAYNHVHGINPNYFTLVTLDELENEGCSETHCIDCDPDNQDVCDSAQGKPRIISRIQHEIEKRGEWDLFVIWLHEKFTDKERVEIFTDLIKLCDSYVEYRKSMV